MLRATYFVAVLLPVLAFAQTPRDQDPSGRMPDHHPPGMMQDHMGGMMHAVGGHQATQPGQAAFGTIQEIVEILEADPATDWSKVDIDALRQHLIDMDNVTLRARVVTTPVLGGARFDITGDNDA